MPWRFELDGQVESFFSLLLLLCWCWRTKRALCGSQGESRHKIELRHAQEPKQGKKYCKREREKVCVITKFKPEAWIIKKIYTQGLIVTCSECVVETIYVAIQWRFQCRFAGATVAVNLLLQVTEWTKQQQPRNHANSPIHFLSLSLSLSLSLFLSRSPAITSDPRPAHNWSISATGASWGAK